MSLVSVSGCHQLSIEAGAFTLPPENSGNLTLRLSDLGWEEVASNIADWSQVAAIDLTSNPLECDCKLLWLKDVLEDMSELSEISANNDTEEWRTSRVFCQHPYSLRGRPLQVRKLRMPLKINSILNHFPNLGRFSGGITLLIHPKRGQEAP
jgi:hypothetical protein